MACRYTLLTFLTQLNQERWSSATYLSTFLTPLNQERSCTHTYIPRGYADHPEDEFSHHKITQTIRPLENFYILPSYLWGICGKIKGRILQNRIIMLSAHCQNLSSRFLYPHRKRRSFRVSSSTIKENMSIQEYIEEHGLGKKVEDVINAAVKAKAPQPIAFMVRSHR